MFCCVVPTDAVSIYIYIYISTVICARTLNNAVNSCVLCQKALNSSESKLDTAE
jgi:hypothetical protein